MAYITLQHLRKAVESLLIKIGNRFDFLNNKVDTLSESLDDVAFSGDYDDLINKPSIPTIPQNISYFNNDAGYVNVDRLVYANLQDTSQYNLPVFFKPTSSLSNIYTITNFSSSFYYTPSESTLKVPYVNGYIIAGRKANTTIGNYATAEGAATTASGNTAHAEGNSTTASGDDAHAEGGVTVASGDCAHAEGYNNTASGNYSHAEGARNSASSQGAHAEGFYTTASGDYSHAEGNYTTAKSKLQHVFGEYNKLDTVGNATTKGTYVEIVGNGTSSARSNARTLDWSGNEVLAGKLTVGTGPTNAMDVATKQYVDSAVSGGISTETDPIFSASAAASITSTDITNWNNKLDNIALADYIPKSATWNNTIDVIAHDSPGSQQGKVSYITSYGIYFQGNNGQNSYSYVGLLRKGNNILKLYGNSSDAANGVRLTNLATPTENSDAVNKLYVDTAIGNINGFEVAVVNSLPTENIDTHTFYFMSNSGSGNNIYDEYLYINNAWEKIGSTEIDLSGYLLSTDIADWAKASTKPSYTATEVGALPDSTDLSVYMQKSVDYVTAGRKANTTAGTDSTAEGSNTTSSSFQTHAEGSGTTASASQAHAEGMSTTASGIRSHAEGMGTTASGSNSHSEGYQTMAAGSYSHSEGLGTYAYGESSHTSGSYTTAYRKNQFVFGRWNIVDGNSPTTEGTYVEIVGNGTANDARSNARTLDWSGNEVLAGKLTVGADPINNMDVATKQYVDSAIPTVPTNISSFTNDAGYITSYTETDPIFSASAAAGITSTDISNWDAKVSDDKTWKGLNISTGSSYSFASKYVPTVDSNTSLSQTADFTEVTSTPTAYRIAKYDNQAYLYSTTPTAGDHSTKVATTQFVTTAISGITYPVTSVNEQTGNVLIDKIKTSAPADNTTYNLMGTASTNVNTQVVDVYNPTLLTFSKYDNNFARLTIGSTSTPGQIRIYSSTSSATGYIDLKSGSTSTNTRTITLPDADGTVALTSDIPNVSSWALAANKPSYTFSELTTTPTTLGGYGITDAYTKTEVDGLVSGVLHYKGVKASVSALPSSGNTTGDVWHITADGSEYAWDGSDWQELGTATDLSGYVPTSRTVNGKALSTDITLSASDVSALPSNTTYVSTFNGQSGAITYTAPVTSVNGQTGAVTITDSDEKVKSSILNKANGAYPLLFAKSNLNSDTTDSVYRSGNILYNDYQQQLSIREADGNRYLNLTYNTIAFYASVSLGGYLRSTTLTQSRNWYLPDATGTIALTSDIPSVPSWALESTKPTYTASEVGALASTVDVTKWNGVSLAKSEFTATNNNFLIPYLTATTSTEAYLMYASYTPTANAIARYNSSRYLVSTTPAASDNSTKAATTAFVKTAIGALTIPTRYDSSTNTTGYLTMADLPIYDGTVI